MYEKMCFKGSTFNIFNTVTAYYLELCMEKAIILLKM